MINNSHYNSGRYALIREFNYVNGILDERPMLGGREFMKSSERVYPVMSLADMSTWQFVGVE